MLQIQCVNVYHFVLLLEAENLSLRRGHQSAAVQSAYDKAISTAARLGVTHIQAISNELAGAYFYNLGDTHWALTYLKRSRSLYGAWGARAKTHQLSEKYADLSSRHLRGTVVKARSCFGDIETTLQVVRVLQPNSFATGSLCES
jgi:hypothetical protein